MDDLKALPLSLRLFLYAITSLAIAVILMAYRLPPVHALDILHLVIAAVMILWILNLYNFMDGIDGIASTQAILACSGAACLVWVSHGDVSYILFCLLLVAAHAGFLWFNFPPARLFMGDAGSVSTGFLIGGLALLGWTEDILDPLCWLVLLALFIVDASCTLIWRLLKRQRITQPHKLHAYQRLSQRWNSHFKVDMLVLGIVLLWLFPIAFAVQKWPEHALIMVILAYLPLLLGMAKSLRLT